MSDLIKITTKDGKQLVSARELHEFLEIGKVFGAWINDMIGYGFEENVDYTTYWSDSKNGNAVEYLGSPQKMSAKGYTKEYIITIDMAKELSMIQRTEKGKQARLYFIECEKKLKEVDLKANLLLAIYNGGQEGIAASKKLTELEVEEATKPLLPKAKFYDEIIDSTTVIGMKEVADILNVKGYGRNNLFKFLRENGILNRRNEPYRKYIEQGLFEIKESKYIVDNEVKIKATTYVTQKGLDYIRKLLNKQNKQ